MLCCLQHQFDGEYRIIFGLDIVFSGSYGFVMPCCIEDRWEAGQTLSRKLMLDLIVAEQKGQKLSVDSAFIEGIRSTLTNSSLDKVCNLVCFYFCERFLPPFSR